VPYKNKKELERVDFGEFEVLGMNYRNNKLNFYIFIDMENVNPEMFQEMRILTEKIRLIGDLKISNIIENVGF
jgi:hypothetical protein